MANAYFQLIHLSRNSFSAVRFTHRLRWKFFLMLLVVTASFSHYFQAEAQTLSTPATIGSVIPIEKVNDLKNQPLALLAKFPEAGAAMARYVAQVITREPSLVDSILSIASDTSPEQASAIGAGLVRGARAIESTQPTWSRTIAAKVMKSDNMWLRTTFAAIGPVGSWNAPLILPATLPPPLLSDTEVGTTPPAGKVRIGASQPKDLEADNEDGEDKKYPAKLEDTDPFAGHGMIIAYIDSDAPQNGAVSTSPTQ